MARDQNQTSYLKDRVLQHRFGKSICPGLVSACLLIPQVGLLDDAIMHTKNILVQGNIESTFLARNSAREGCNGFI